MLLLVYHHDLLISVYHASVHHIFCAVRYSNRTSSNMQDCCPTCVTPKNANATHDGILSTTTTVSRPPALEISDNTKAWKQQTWRSFSPK